MEHIVLNLTPIVSQLAKEQCWGCKNYIDNQLGHMEPNGICLAAWDEQLSATIEEGLKRADIRPEKSKDYDTILEALRNHKEMLPEEQIAFYLEPIIRRLARERCDGCLSDVLNQYGHMFGKGLCLAGWESQVEQLIDDAIKEAGYELNRRRTYVLQSAGRTV